MNLTPKEALSKINHVESHFKVFNCEVWACIPYEKHKSMQLKREQCIFVDYAKNVKSH
jgi:hypothetical protein